MKVIHSADAPLIMGPTEGVVYDLTRKTYSTLPQEEALALLQCHGQEVEKVHSEVSAKWLDRWYEEEWIFDCPDSQVDLFPAMSTLWKSPTLLYTAQVHLAATQHIGLSFLDEILEAGASHLQLWGHTHWSMADIRPVLEHTQYSRLSSIQLVVPFTSAEAIDSLSQLAQEYPRLTLAFISDAPVNKIFKSNTSDFRLILSDNTLEQVHTPKIGAKHMFTVNPQVFREAHHANLYFNQKVAIDKDGGIRNAMTTPTVWGNVRHDSLSSILSSKDFQALWSVKKDAISVCKDCPYRYMCTDERIPTREGDIWVHATSCRYDPYLGIWN